MSFIQEGNKPVQEMKVIQINLNHCEAAQDLLGQMVAETEADLVMVSEPFKVPANSVWISDGTKKAALWICGKYPFQEAKLRQEDGYAIAKINNIYFFSCYAPPSLQLSEYESMIDKIVAEARGHHPIVIAGDFNAWAEEWGSKYTNIRGKTLLEAFSQLDVILANRGNTSTFRKNGHQSVIDITFTSWQLSKKVKWHVSERYTHSDHQAVIFEVGTQSKAKKSPINWRRKGWVSNALDEELFLELLRDISIPESTAEEKVNYVIRQIHRACNGSMPKRTLNNRRKPSYWWNDEIKDLRSKCHKARRRSQRSVNRLNYEEEHREYIRLRKLLRDEIRSSKRESFKQLCDEADTSPWGSAFRVVMSKIKGQRTPQECCPELLHNIVTELFPQHPPKSDHRDAEHKERYMEEIPEITVEEMLDACRKVGVNKAPGPDMIPNKALKAAIRSNPNYFVNLTQSCLDEGVFPRIWKKQRLVLLHKAGKPPGVPSSYRPLCMLDTGGKILERILQNRLVLITESDGGLSPNQFGFRKARSTLDAINAVVSKAKKALQGKRWKGGTKQYCATITLDIRNAFNTANWGHIMKALRELKVPEYLLKTLDSYFKDRVLVYDSEDGPKEYNITSGVPQGSVLGPILWNVMYNNVLNLQIPDGVEIIGFADDIAIVVSAKHLDEIEMVANETISIVKNWLESVGLELAEHKTEAVLISSRKKRDTVSFKVGNHVIKSKESIKYLGVMLDDRLSFKSHINYTCGKASRVYSALSNMLPNIGGPRSSRRLLLSRVVSSVLLYGAPIWSEALGVKSNRKQLAKIYRLTTLRVISAYRTTSDEAACVLAGMIPIDILVNEARRIYETKRRSSSVGQDIQAIERVKSMQSWQERWDTAVKGRWTHRLIPLIEPWLKRKHGEVNYHLTQFLTGHGGYRSYLQRFGHDDTSLCPSCNKVEDPEHVLFECPRFEAERMDLRIAAGTNLGPDNIIDEMLKSQRTWDACCATITTIQKELRRLEKIRIESTRE